jgi:hypothetical protein
LIGSSRIISSKDGTVRIFKSEIPSPKACQYFKHSFEAMRAWQLVTFRRFSWASFEFVKSEIKIYAESDSIRKREKRIKMLPDVVSWTLLAIELCNDGHSLPSRQT